MRASLRAGTVAAVLSGVASTAWAPATRVDPREPSLAAGSMLLPRATSRPQLLAAVRDLPVLPQVADHLAYGAIVGALLARPISPA
jgi:hypothetical protein